MLLSWIWNLIQERKEWTTSFYLPDYLRLFRMAAIIFGYCSVINNLISCDLHVERWYFKGSWHCSSIPVLLVVLWICLTAMLLERVNDMDFAHLYSCYCRCYVKSWFFRVLDCVYWTVAQVLIRCRIVLKSNLRGCLLLHRSVQQLRSASEALLLVFLPAVP